MSLLVEFEGKKNVVSLFGERSLQYIPDPLTNLLDDATLEDLELSEPVPARRNVVLESQFPDQSMFTLDQQLASLKSKMNRIKYYLEHLDDILP